MRPGKSYKKPESLLPPIPPASIVYDFSGTLLLSSLKWTFAKHCPKLSPFPDIRRHRRREKPSPESKLILLPRVLRVGDGDVNACRMDTAYVACRSGLIADDRGRQLATTTYLRAAMPRLRRAYVYGR